MSQRSHPFFRGHREAAEAVRDAVLVAIAAALCPFTRSQPTQNQMLTQRLHVDQPVVDRNVLGTHVPQFGSVKWGLASGFGVTVAVFVQP